MKKGLFVVLIFVAAFSLHLLSYDFRAETKRDYTKYELSQKEMSMLRDGDIILRHGYGMVSDGIIETMKDEYHVSHCAILIQNPDGSFKVIHSVSQSLSPYDGVQEQTMEKFFHDSQKNSLMVVRLKQANDSTCHRISQRANYYLQERIPFDHAFDINDTSSFYCSEFIWLVIKDEFGVDIFKDKLNEQKDHLKMSNFWNPEYFDIIINHNIKR